MKEHICRITPRCKLKDSAWIVVVLAMLPGAIQAAVLTVTNINDSGLGSLRQAILDANTNANLDTIAFNIPGAATYTITPLTSLPVIYKPVFIDGRRQLGFTNAPIVQIDGTKLGTNGIGLYVSGSGCKIQGLNIVNCQLAGIFITAGGSNTIRGNYLGHGFRREIGAAERVWNREHLDVFPTS